MGKSSPSFCRRDGGTVYRYGATLLSSDNGTATYLYVLNGHGDVAQMLAGTTVVKSYNYDAFGNEIGINTADTNPFRYCAQYYDKESGTIYLRARYYAPGVGRFTQQDGWAYADPAVPASLNLYVYCWNDPVRYYDPSGHWVHLLVGAVVGGVVSGAVSLGSQLVSANGDFKNVDVTKVALSMFFGAVSGVLAATGVPLGGQIAGNVLIGMSGNFAEQVHEIDSPEYERTEIDLVDIGFSGIAGGIAGYVGGAGGGNNAVKSLSDQLVKRTINAMKNDLGIDVLIELEKAYIYYVKSASTMLYNEIIKNIVKASSVSVAQKIIEATGLHDDAKQKLYEFAESME